MSEYIHTFATVKPKLARCSNKWLVIDGRDRGVIYLAGPNASALMDKWFDASFASFEQTEDGVVFTLNEHIAGALLGPAHILSFPALHSGQLEFMEIEGHA